MNGLTGTRPLARLAVRRDFLAVVPCSFLIAALVVVTARLFKRLYPTAAARAVLVSTAHGNPALRFLYGTLQGNSIGALTAWRYGVWATIFVALMSVFVVIRHTRADEEAGRLELVGSTPVGRQAPLGAALLVAIVADLAIAGLMCLWLPVEAKPGRDAAALGLAVGAGGLAFVGIAAVVAQLTSGARAARGIALGVLGMSYVLRGIGDAAGAGSALSWLTWVSPLGWTEKIRPFASSGGVRWWVLCLPLLVFCLGVLAAFVLSARRDLGSGLIQDRAGRPAASRFLSGPFGLAGRLQWPSLAGYLTGYVVAFTAAGAAVGGISQIIGSSGRLRHVFTRIGGQHSLDNAYLAALMLVAGLVAAGYLTTAVLRLRLEETDGLAEPVLAAAVSRLRWALSHILVAGVGAALLLVVAGVAAGIGDGLAASSAGAVSVGGEVAQLTGAALAELPAVLVPAGIAVLAFGLAPRWSIPVAWTAVGLVVVLTLFGSALQLTHWVMDVSPFTQVPRLPGGPVFVAPLVCLCAIALASCLAGLYALGRRDIG